jgi:hypothetical protein
MRTLDELLENPASPLTREEWNGFREIMLETNDDRPAHEVDIGPAVQRDIAEIKAKGSYWW